MDVKPKSNKLKRLEMRRKREARAERRAREDARAAAAARRRRVDQALRSSGRPRLSTRQTLGMIIEGRDVPAAIGGDLAPVARLFQDLRRRSSRSPELPGPDLDALKRLALSCYGRTGFFRGHEAHLFANALLALSIHAGRWVRMPEDWKPASHNTYRQFHALARHLLASYDVPTFMNSVWLRDYVSAEVVTHQRWFIHIGQGENIRTAQGLPIPLTKMQAHLFLEAPDDFDVLRAIRRAQILDLGGSERLVRAVLATWLAAGFDHEDFWVSVFRWFVAHPMLDPAQVGPIVDYLNDQRFQDAIPNPRAHLPGQPGLIPRQPNLTMKGRSPEALLRSVAEWHRELGRLRAAAATSWGPSGFSPFRLEEGLGEGRRVSTITEVLTARELVEEGQAMNHCVATYAQSCASGRSSIWSVRVINADGLETRSLTVEVLNQTGQIVQARGRFNVTPKRRELSLLRRWGDAGGPTLSNWLAR
jgi:hypothetical protein